jgi:hypothetical protein
MAGLLLHVNSGEAALVSATAKTMLQIKAPANQRLLIKELRIFGKQPAGGTDAVVKVRMTRSTTNFGTGTSATPGKNNPSNGETPQSSCYGNFTVEPTSPADGGLWWELQPQSGIIEFQPAGMAIEVPGGASVQFEFTSAVTPTVMMQASYEE